MASRYLVCFGLDRVWMLETTDRTFTLPADFEASTYFADSFGIFRPTDGMLAPSTLRA